MRCPNANLNDEIICSVVSRQTIENIMLIDPNNRPMAAEEPYEVEQFYDLQTVIDPNLKECPFKLRDGI